MERAETTSGAAIPQGKDPTRRICKMGDLGRTLEKEVVLASASVDEDDRKHSLLTHACAGAHYACARLLQSHGVDPNFQGTDV